MKSIKVFICDDHQLIIDGIKSILKNNENISVIGDALNGLEALEKINKNRPDVVLIDVDMPIMNGYETTLELRKHYSDIKVIILTMFNDKSLINKMIGAGASGYILKNKGEKEILEAIYKVHGGETYFSTELFFTISKNSPEEAIKNTNAHPITLLTKREINILSMIAQGLSNNEIGKKIFISKRTVDTHRYNIMKKLNILNIAGLIKYAIKNGLI